MLVSAQTLNLIDEKFEITYPFLTQTIAFLKTILFIYHSSLDTGLRKFEIFSIFKANIIKFIRPFLNFVVNFYNSDGIYLITRLRP